MKKYKAMVLSCIDPRFQPKVYKYLKDKNLTVHNYFRCMVNLTKPMDVNFIHTHPDQIVALHYSNLTWNPEWGGETLFYKDNKRDILLSSRYVPN